MTKERNGTIVKWLAILGIAGLLGGWIWQAAIQSGALEANTRDDAEIHPKVLENREDILIIQSDLRYIRKGVDDIQRKLE